MLNERRRVAVRFPGRAASPGHHRRHAARRQPLHGVGKGYRGQRHRKHTGLQVISS